MIELNTADKKTVAVDSRPRRSSWLQIWHQPNPNRWLQGLRFVLTIVYLTGRSRLKLYAASLTYISLLATVPTLAIVFSISKIFGASSALNDLVKKALSPTGEAGDEVAGYLLQFVQNANVGLLGTVGVAFLFYSIYSLIQQIESVLNYIWQTVDNRPLKKKIINYLGAIVAAVLVGSVAITLNVSFHGQLFKQWFPDSQFAVYFYGFLSKGLSILVTSWVLAILYYSIPNVYMRFRSAFLGGLFCALSWIPLTVVFTKIISASSSYSLIYSSFASVIILLIWLNTLWLLFLSGALVSYYVQYPNLLKKEAIDVLKPAALEYHAKVVLGLIREQFRSGQGGICLNTLIAKTHLSRKQLIAILQPFINRNLLYRLDDERDVQFLLAVSPEHLNDQLVLEVTRGRPPTISDKPAT